MKERKEKEAICGLSCYHCPIMVGEVRETAKRLREILEKVHLSSWVERVSKQIPVLSGYNYFDGILAFLEYFFCAGCPEGGDPTCAIKICALNRSLSRCADCIDYPCELIKTYQTICSAINATD